MSEELKEELQEEKAEKMESVETAEKEPNYVMISKILMIIGAVATAVASFLPSLNSVISGVTIGSLSVSSGLSVEVGKTLPGTLFIIPIVIAVVIAVLAFLAKGEKKTPAYIGGCIGAISLAGIVTLHVFAMKATLSIAKTAAILNGISSTEADVTFGLGYYLFVIGYLLVLGGAVGCKGLDSISSGEDEEEESSEEKKEEDKDAKEETADQKED